MPSQPQRFFHHPTHLFLKINILLAIKPSPHLHNRFQVIPFFDPKGKLIPSFPHADHSPGNDFGPKVVADQQKEQVEPRVIDLSMLPSSHLTSTCLVAIILPVRRTLNNSISLPTQDWKSHPGAEKGQIHPDRKRRRRIKQLLDLPELLSCPHCSNHLNNET